MIPLEQPPSWGLKRKVIAVAPLPKPLLLPVSQPDPVGKYFRRIRTVGSDKILGRIGEFLPKKLILFGTIDRNEVTPQIHSISFGLLPRRSAYNGI
ncbi:MAG: hypothetical protein EBZ78_12030 [Verrucomicrobia bacterium]|nr:hypothetical protein [Verrucomicrobiota bacterium]